MRSQAGMSTPTSVFTLYRFYATDDTLLYVGLTTNPGQRFKKHRGEKPWWPEIARIEMEYHPTLAALQAAEREAITTEKPRYNVQLNRGNAAAKYEGNHSQPEGLIGRFFHSYPEGVREWQGHVIDRDGDLFIVELFSWWDGMPNGQKLVTVEQMQSWKFYDTAIEMQIADGCPESDPDLCGGPVTHYLDHRHWEGGIHWLCSSCVQRYPGFSHAKAIRWNRDGKPYLR
jgi:predicted GIY-YIG superfamily endonuclease